MTETTLVYLVVFKLVLLGLFSLFYVLGGRSNKWLRRYVAGIGFPLGLILISLISNNFKWLSLSLIALYPINLSLGYGGDTLYKKLALRGIYGLFGGILGIFCGYLWGNHFLGWAQLTLALTGSLSLGVLNPTHAVDEEALISLFLVILIPFMI